MQDEQNSESFIGPLLLILLVVAVVVVAVAGGGYFLYTSRLNAQRARDYAQQALTEAMIAEQRAGARLEAAIQEREADEAASEEESK